MATIPEPLLFGWHCVDQLGDLQRLQLVLDAIPDEPLMRLLEGIRHNGRNDYPVRATWNSLELSRFGGQVIAEVLILG